MSEDLLRRLRLLEEDYAGQPVVAQEGDLQEINRIRAELGRPLVDARLNEIATPVEKPPPQAANRKPDDSPRHTEARAIYEAYLAKAEELELHRDYANRVARATGGPGQTPVRPLATMGTNGGPLLCDHCGKAILLEGAPFHGVRADAAWARNPHPSDNWTSWILGGMVVEIEINGTLRIYHGYPGNDQSHCCNIASRQEKKARDNFVKSPKSSESQTLIHAFIKKEFPGMTTDEQGALLGRIMTTMYSYDPGLGVNRPSKIKKT
jgi:hypothetical protein